MFTTKNFVIEGSDVPSTWVFQYYLDLPESLTGQDLKIKSIFNPSERTPSFCIYVDKTIMQYKFKDFSTGKSGNKVDLVKSMLNLSFSEAMRKIVEDYNIYVKSSEYKNIKITPQEKWKVDYIKTRDWNTNDQIFWLSFNIGKTMLTEYNIKAIEYYNLVKEENGEVKKLKIQNQSCYGYFDKDDKVYKIYQPFSKSHKFYKVKPYLQGFDQLKYNQPYLIICSSLKDALCLKSIGYNIEVIAPDSENTMIKPHVVEYLKKKYDKVITLFDNDDAGKHAVDMYAKTYNIDGFVPTICKDISDAMVEHGFDKVHAMLRPLLKTILKN
tara:strand:+ start:1163 stop:2140 length:978 start_codon:yes stop_codon:yes gene_type:complete